MDPLKQLNGKMKQLVKICLLGILLTTLFSQKVQEFDITFLGLKVAKVEIISIDSVFNSLPARFIQFNANTSSFAYSVFPTSCTYQMFVDEDNSIKYFYKETEQPNVKNKIETEIINKKIFYRNTDVELKPNMYNIFSLLDFISLNRTTIPKVNNFKLEREGLVYNAHIIKNLESTFLELNIEIDSEKNQTSVLQDTDIFSWAVFKPNASRKIWIDIKNKNISKCEFKFGFWKLTAENVNHESD